MGKESKNPVYVHGSKREYVTIKHSGTFDMDGLLNGMTGYLKNLRYDIGQKEHTESVRSDGKETKLIWRCFREVTEYIKYYLEITIIILHQVDVIVDGKTMQTGDVEIRLMSRMEKNWKESFNKTPVGKTQRHVYEKVVAKEKLGDSEERLEGEGNGLLAVAKEYLH